MGLLEILKLVLELIRGAKDLAAFVEANREEKWFQDSSATFSELRKVINDPSLTKEQRSQKYRDAGRGIGDLISRL